MLTDLVLRDRKSLVNLYRKLSVAFPARDVATAEAAFVELTRRVNISVLSVVESLIQAEESSGDE